MAHTASSPIFHAHGTLHEAEWSTITPQNALRVTRSLFVDDGTVTSELFSDLKLTRTKPMRIAVIALIAMNILAAVLTAASILHDSWTAAHFDRNHTMKRRQIFFVIDVHPAEVFPLAISLTILAQGLVFVAVQGTGLQSVMVDHCTSVAQVVWPALWIVPYVTLVFGLEFVHRSLRKPGLLPRQRWSVLICSMTVVILLVITWIPSAVSPSQQWCIANLVRWGVHFAPIAIIIASVLLLLLSVSAVILFLQLSKNASIARDERIAASRMVYHLALGILSLTLLLPYYIDLTLQRTASVTSMIASVVLNLSGISTCVLHLFLRFVPAANAIWPKMLLRRRRQRSSETDLIEPRHLNFENHLKSPTKAPLVCDVGPTKDDFGSFSPSTYPFTRLSEEDEQNGPSTSQASRTISTNHKPATPVLDSPQAALSPIIRSRSGSAYSLFPGGPPALYYPPTSPKGPECTFTPTSPGADQVLRPPRPLFADRSRHRRDSSMESSATIQFGLRLSEAPSSMILPEDERQARGESPTPLTSQTQMQTQTPQRLQRSPLGRKTSVDKPLPPDPSLRDFELGLDTIKKRVGSERRKGTRWDEATSWI